MLFAEYVQLLHKYINPGTGIDPYMEELLTHCFPNDKSALSSKPTRERHYKGIIDKETSSILADRIREFAIYFKDKLDIQSLSDYIKDQITNPIHIKELCKVFKDEQFEIETPNSPDVVIDNNNYSILIAKALKVILYRAAQDPRSIEKRIQTSTRQSENKHQSKNTQQSKNKGIVISDDDLLNIKITIRQLCLQIDTLRQLGRVYHYEQFIKQLQDEKSADDKKVQEYKEAFDLFSYLDKEMHFWCHKYPGSLFDKVKHYTNSLDEYCFITRKIKPIDVSDETNSGSDATSNKLVICAECDPDVELYYDALVELARSLDNRSS